jgi:hypothetical protein
MFIGVTPMSLSTKENLEVHKVGEKRKNFQFIIEQI